MEDIKILLVNESLKNEWIKYSKWSHSVNEEVIHIKNGYSLIATINDEMAGIICIVYKNLDAPLQNLKQVYIDNLEVREEFYKKGIATALINKVIENAEKTDYYQIGSWSSVDKIGAIHLWKKLGFTLSPVTQHFGNDQIRGFLVAKKL